jgi:superfamily II DNA or RNA helicase
MADMTLTQHVRLQQIAGGFIALDNAEDEKAPPDMIPIGSTKLRKLKALSRRLEPPFVVFCKYKAELFAVHRMMSVLYDRVELFYGKTPRDERDRLQADFQNGLIEVLICQNRTGGLGIDLYRTSTAIIYSLTFSYIDFDQLISRFDLYKKKQAVKIILLLAQNSIDEDVLSLVLNKENVSESTLRKLQRRRSKSMATKKKKVTKKVTKKAAKAPKASETKKAAGAPKASETFKYTVADLAKVLGIKEASVRIKLRNNEIDKAGRAYGWNSKAEYEKVLKQLKA